LLETLAAAVEGTPLALWAAADPRAYPVANVVHLVGLVLLVGAIGIVDLRILGVLPMLDLRALALSLTPLALGGLVMMAASGVVLFAADARALAGSDVFAVKLMLLGLALANALLFRGLHHRRLLFGAVRPGMQTMAALSILLWLGVLVAGRWIAYA
jgi:hypothetical protein